MFFLNRKIKEIKPLEALYYMSSEETYVFGIYYEKYPLPTWIVLRTDGCTWHLYNADFKKKPIPALGQKPAFGETLYGQAYLRVLLAQYEEGEPDFYTKDYKRPDFNPQRLVFAHNDEMKQLFETLFKKIDTIECVYY